MCKAPNKHKNLKLGKRGLHGLEEKYQNLCCVTFHPFQVTFRKTEISVYYDPCLKIANYSNPPKTIDCGFAIRLFKRAHTF